MGYEEARVSYYYCETTTAVGTYKFFLAWAQHSGIGYTYLHIFTWYPRVFISIIDWNTDLFLDQELDDWGPKSTGSNTVVTYGLTAGISGGDPTASASVSYSVDGGLLIAWSSQTVAAQGFHKTTHNIGADKYDVAYTVEPSSVGLLDPEIDGSEPMTVYQQFDITATYSCGVNWWASLYNNYATEP